MQRIDSHEDRVHKGAKIALEDASKANWHMHALLYGLIKLLMDDVMGSRLKTSSKFASTCWTHLHPSESVPGIHRHRSLA